MNNRIREVWKTLLLGVIVSIGLNVSANAQFTELWNRSGASVPSWVSTTNARTIAYHNKKLYISNSSSGKQILIVNAETGTDIGTISAAAVTGSWPHTGSIAVSQDGKIFFSNITSSASTVSFRVWMWEDDQDTSPEVVIDYTSSIAERIGDKINVVGSVEDGTAVLYASVGTTARVYRWVVQSDGEGGYAFTNSPTTAHNLLNMSEYGTPASSTGAEPGGSSSYFATGRSATSIRQYTSSGTNLGYVGFASGNKNVGSLSYQTINDQEFLFTYHPTARQVRVHSLAGSPGGTWTNRTGTDFGITTAIGSTTENTYGDLAVVNNGDGTFTVFVMATQNGLAAFITNNLLATDTHVRLLSGEAGWRFLSSPVNNTALSTLLADQWTQGFTGASATNGSSNAYTFNASTQTFVAPSSLSDELASGQGLAYLAFADNDLDGTNDAFPRTLTVSGTAHTADVNSTLAANKDEFALLGNPYDSGLSWQSVYNGASNLYSTAWVWDPNSGVDGAYVELDGLSASAKIAKMQGFFVASSADSPLLTLSTSQLATGASFLGKIAEIPLVELKGLQNGVETSTLIRLLPDAEIGQDRYDAAKLQSWSSRYFHLFTENESGKTLAINSLPLLTEVYEIPFGINTTEQGDIALSLKNMSLLPGWTAFLIDSETDARYELNENFSFSFTPPVAKMTSHVDVNPTPVVANSAYRFYIEINPAKTTSTEKVGGLPSQMQLNQNYPNPFNPSTTLSYSLPKQSAVRLTVVDLLGREVAYLVNSVKAAGNHSVTFDGSGLSSGMYLYRLEANGQVLINKMTLIK